FALPSDLRTALIALPQHFWTSFNLRPELLLPCTREGAMPQPAEMQRTPDSRSVAMSNVTGPAPLTPNVSRLDSLSCHSCTRVIQNRGFSVSTSCMTCRPHPRLVWPLFALFFCLVLARLSLGQQIPAESLQEDFQIMRHALEEAHGGLYRYTSK